MVVRALQVVIVIVSLAVCCADKVVASPATVMGELGEGMANQAWCGSTCAVVDTHYGRHGIDFLYYDTRNGEEKLYVSEVKSGASQPNQALKLSDNELKLLQKQGIRPESMPGGLYKVPQGTHAYNLVQMERKTADFTKLNASFDTLKSGGNISKKDAKRLAQHLESMKISLDPVEAKLLRQAKDQENVSLLKEVIKRREGDFTSAQQQAATLFQKAQADVASNKYTNQLVRVTSKDGRFTLINEVLDKNTGLPTGAQETQDVHWKNYRESGPYRSLVKKEASRLCQGDRRCTDSAYKSAMTRLEQDGNLHKAMQEMDQVAKSSPTNPTSPPAKGNNQTSSAAKGKTASAAPESISSAKPQATDTAAKAANATNLRKTPLLTRVKALAASRIGTTAGRLSTRMAPLLNVAATINPAVIAAVAVTTAVIAADSYIDNKLDAQTEKLKEHFGSELKVVNENIGFVRQDLQAIGEQVDYKFAISLETMDRHHQVLTGQLDDLDQQLAAGFTGLSETLLVVDQKQNYGLALQEAQFDDALQSGLKHYDVYLGTADPEYLATAEREFTLAQARYENLLNKPVDLADHLANYRTQHALSSYYRIITYGERAVAVPQFADQAIRTFTALLDQIHDPEHLESVLPIVNYAYASIVDLDGEDLAAARLMQAYTDLIDHYLALNHHNLARAYAGLLTMIIATDEAQRLNAFVRYVTGTDENPGFDPWEMDEKWIKYVEARETPKAGTIYALLACGESQEANIALPDYCTLSTQAILDAASKFDNEMAHRYLIKSLLDSNRIHEADQLLNQHYLSDADFRIRSQINIAYYKRNERGESDAYCRLANHVVSDITFPKDLRADVSRHLDRWGKNCSKTL